MTTPLQTLMASNGAAAFLQLLEEHRADYCRTISSRTQSSPGGVILSGGPDDRAVTAGGLEFIQRLIDDAVAVQQAQTTE